MHRIFSDRVFIRVSLQLWLGILIAVFTARAQQSQFATLVGHIVDDSTSTPLGNVNVYIANTTLGANTNESGRFEIRNIPPGSYDVVASRIGYLFFTVRVHLRDPQKKEIDIRLKPSNVELNEVVVSAADPAEWRSQLHQFDEYFIGLSKNARECRITNPEVLDFKAGQGDLFEATARKPLEIENLALGYHIQFYLATFRVQNETMKFEGLPKFTELVPASAKEEKRWKENRMAAYRGSLRHFLSSLFNRRLRDDGFAISQIDFLELHGVSSARKVVTEDDVLYPSSWPTQKTLRFGGLLEVEYRGDVEDGFNLLRKPGSMWQISWLALNYYSVAISERGDISEPFPTKTYGYWSWRRVADMLPLDFEPEKK